MLSGDRRAVLQCGRDRCGTASKARKHHADDGGQERQGHRKRHDAGVHVDLVQPRDIRRSKRDRGTQRPRREDDGHERGQHGAQCGLRQMLSDDACPAGAERQSNGHLPRTRGATRNRETRHVGADEQEQTKHRAEHEQ